LLSPEQIEALVLPLFETASDQYLTDQHPAFDVLSNIDFQWSDSLTRLVWPLIPGTLEQAKIDYYKLSAVYSKFAQHMNPSQWLLNESEALLQAYLDKSHLQNQVTEFATLIRFRYEMHQEFLS
jgi:hypothetical protein